MKCIKIAIFSKADSSGGGAGRVAEDLAIWLNQKPNIEAHHWVGWAKNEYSYTKRLHGNRTWQFVYKVFRFIFRKIGLPDFFPLELLIFLITNKENYDIYHFHDYCSAISPVTIRYLSKLKPSVWTFHDCSPFTGGCIHPSYTNCVAFHKQCKNCPQLQEWPLLTYFDFTGWMQNYKLNILKSRNITIVTPSNWLAKEALKTNKLPNAPHVIFNAVDTSIFKPYNKRLMRNKLGLAENDFLILLTATSLQNERKGSQYAVDAINRLDRQVHVLAIGKPCHLALNVPVTYTGYIHDQSVLAQYYAAADVFLFPTLAESFGLVAIESMACGTPVIGFSVGGVPEIVDHDVNGWLVPAKDVDGLVAGLMIAQTQGDRLRYWVENGLQKVKACYQPSTFLERHLSLYDSLLNQ